MSYTLLIAEKPLAAKKIAKALAENKSFKICHLNGVEYYQFYRNGKKYVVVPAVGHLFTLHNKSAKWSYPVFEFYWAPIFEVRKKAEFAKKYFEVIKELAKNAKDFIICCDFDTEGTVIGANILKFICKKENAKRMKFSTLTRDEIISSFENMMPNLDFNQLEAGLTRHSLDWIYGINLTRALTLALKNSFHKVFSIISTGRVQGPTLSILYEKEKEIKRFKPRNFWQLFLDLIVKGKKIRANYEKERFWKEDEVRKVFLECKKVKTAKIIEIKRKKYKQLPPVPFNTTDLQTEAYNQFKFSPTQTLAIAESLYQAGYISYPRSSSQKLPPAINYEKILKSLSKISAYKNFASELLGKELKPREGKKEDPAHPAIYPTAEVPDLKKLSKQQRKIYDLIVRRFFAVFGEAAIRESLKVVLDVNGKKFLLTGKRTLEEGWTKYYKPYLAVDEIVLPELKIGDELKILNLKIIKKQTQPPARFTQGSIIKEMEKRNLGTRATRAEILQTLYDRKYIVGKSIRVTKLGETVIKVLKEFCPRILSEELTRKFENEMELVFNGEKKREEVIEEAKNVLNEILKEFKKNEIKIGKKLAKGLIEAREEERVLGKCKYCKGDLLIFRMKNGKVFAGCSNYPKCKSGYPLPRNATIRTTEKICEKCGTPIIQVFRKGKRAFRMCLDTKCETKKNWAN